MKREERFYSGEWIPVRLHIGEELGFDWMHIGAFRYTHPFFDETIRFCKSRSPHSGMYLRSSAEELIAAADAAEALSPDAFIFHVSRCGSTLLSQLLAESETHIALSEVPLLDELLRLPIKYPGLISAAQLEKIFKAVIRLLGRKRFPQEKQLFIKTDSWHIFFAEQIRRWYPDVPFVFLYREPIAVVQSQLKHSGQHAVPGLIEPELFGFDPAEIITLPQPSYMARVLEKYYEAFRSLAQADSLVTLVSYNEGVQQLIDAVFAAVNILPGEALREKITARIKFHSKKPGEVFSNETAETKIPDDLINAHAAWQQLEAQREK